MKKLKILTLFLAVSLICALAAGCGNQALYAPSGLFVNADWELSWAEVENASGYSIEVVSDETGEVFTYNTRRTHISLEDLEEGNYSYKIKSLALGKSGTDSDWSEVKTFHKDYENGCTYKLDSTGLSYFVSRAGTAQGAIIISDTFRGKPVIGIAAGAFKGNNKVTSIEIVGDIQYIEDMAFYNCTSLESIKISDSVIYMGTDVFAGCGALSEVNIPSTITALPTNIFMFCKSLTTLPLNDNITSISDGAFKDCVSLTEINIPNSIVTIGNEAFENCTGATSVTIGEGVTSIGSSAFSNLTSLTKITYAEDSSLTKIGSYAFAYCSSLESTEVPEGVTVLGNYVYSNCEKLSSVTIPDSLVEMGAGILRNTQIYEDAKTSGSPFVYAGNWITGCYSDGTEESPLYTLSEVSSVNVREGTVGIAAYACNKFEVLYKVVLPDSVKYVGNYAFANCPMLQQFKVNDTSSLDNIGYYCFSESERLKAVSLGQAITRINGYAFYGCTSIVTNELGVKLIPESVTSVGTYAFNDTGIWVNADEDSLVYVDNWIVGYKGTVVAPQIKEIDGDLGIADYAFYECETLTSIDISKARYIGEYAFSKCSELTTVSLNRNLREIKKGTFYRCKSLYNVAMPPRIKSIGDYAFYGCPTMSEVNLADSTVETIGNWAFAGDSNIKSVALGDYLTKIGDYAFYGCTSLRSLEMPSCMDSIGSRAFAYNTSLQTLTLNEGLTTIGDYAFNTCERLREIDLPSTVTKLGMGAFYGCSNVEKVVLNENLEYIGAYCFTNIQKLANIYIPESVQYIGTGSFMFNTYSSFVLGENITNVGEHVFFGNPALTVYTCYEDLSEITEKLWNSNFAAVVYGCELSADNSYVVSLTITESTFELYYGNTVLADPTREGYTFKGWTDNLENPSVVYTTSALLSMNDGTTVYALWEKTVDEPAI